MKEGIKHIFFDLDRTLWDFESNSREALKEMFQALNLGKGGKVEEGFFVDRYLFHNDHLWDLYRADKVTKGRLRKERFRRSLADIGIEDSSIVNQASVVYVEICPKKTLLVDGAMDIVEALHGRYQLQILTNGFQEAQSTKMEVTGLAPFFEHVITSERASSRKPQPRIYEVAQNITGAKAEESLMIGDSLDIDVRGALSAGWKAIHYNCDGREHELTSVNRLADLRALLL